jgi:hypothetical protein
VNTLHDFSPFLEWLMGILDGKKIRKFNKMQIFTILTSRQMDLSHIIGLRGCKVILAFFACVCVTNPHERSMNYATLS